MFRLFSFYSYLFFFLPWGSTNKALAAILIHRPSLEGENNGLWAKTNTPLIDVRLFTLALEREILVQGTHLKLRGIEGTYHSLRLSCSGDVVIEGRLLPTKIVSLDGNKVNLSVQGPLLIKKNKKTCEIIHQSSLEEYLSTLLSREMNSAWEIEALKAQAVAARSYALYKKRQREELKRLGRKRNFDLENSESDQVNGHFFDHNDRTLRASYETQGEVLTKENSIVVPGFYHAECGGKTFLPSDVWSNTVIGYQRVACPFCQGEGRSHWESVLSRAEWQDLNKWAGPKLALATSQRYESEQIPLFRRYFGRKKFLSNSWELQKTSNSFKIKGRGRGHGVGMCQLGALYLARQGKSYRDILKHYYPELKVEKLY